MEKIMGEILVIISLILGTGFSARILHDKVRRLAIEAIARKQP